MGRCGFYMALPGTQPSNDLQGKRRSHYLYHTQACRAQSKWMLKGAELGLAGLPVPACAPELSWQLPAFPGADGWRLPQRACGTPCCSSHGKFRPLVFLITPGVLFFPGCEHKLSQGHSCYSVPRVPSPPGTAFLAHKSSSHGKLAGVHYETWAPAR